MWELDCEETWVLKNWCFWTVVLEKTLESPLDCKEIQPAHPEGDQSWVFIGRTDAEAETPILWLPQCEELTHWKRPWFWEGLGAGGEGDDRGWDGLMASPARCTLHELLELVMDREAWCAMIHGITESNMTERLNWTERTFLTKFLTMSYKIVGFFFNSIIIIASMIDIFFLYSSILYIVL